MIIRDFTRTEIIEDFYASLESTLEGKTGEGAIYMGQSHLGIRLILNASTDGYRHESARLDPQVPPQDSDACQVAYAAKEGT